MAYDDKFRPPTIEVASYIKNRTVDEHNNFVGDFTENTIVTVIEVGRIIDQAGEMVLAALRWDPELQPVPISDSNVPAVRSLIALFSAIVVEVTKFSEQINRQVSPYPYLKELFDKMLAEKQAELGIQPPAGTGGGGLTLVDLIASQFGGVDYAFPDNQMVNWDTAF